jgi:hypothetical protein
MDEVAKRGYAPMLPSQIEGFAAIGTMPEYLAWLRRQEEQARQAAVGRVRRGFTDKEGRNFATIYIPGIPSIRKKPKPKEQLWTPW